MNFRFFYHKFRHHEDPSWLKEPHRSKYNNFKAKKHENISISATF